MRSELDKLLEAIDPSKTLDVRHAQADDAINSFKITTAHLNKRSQTEIDEVLCQFGAHVVDSMLHCKCPIRGIGSFCWIWYRYLEGKYGSRFMNDVERLIHNGTNGGLPALMREVAHVIADHFANSEIGARVAEFYPPLDLDVQMEIAREYLRKWSHLLPEDIVAKGPSALITWGDGFLWKHPHRLRLYRIAVYSASGHGNETTPLDQPL